LTEHVDVAPPDGLSGQGEELKVPCESDSKLTVPVGLDRVPVAVSVTVAVHDVDCDTTTLVGLQLTETLVWCRPTAKPPGPLDPACSAESPPGYSAVILCVPESTLVALYSTEQVDAAPPDGLNGQVGELKVPFESDLKLTDPVGPDRVPLAVSVTVTVHVAACATTTGEPQLTAVLVVRGPTTTSLNPLDALCSAGSPPGYSAVILCVPDSTFVASYLTEQVDASPPDALNAQVGELNVPFRLDLKLTDPVGLDRVGLAVSLTVTMHVVGCETTTFAGTQLTAVLVVRGPTTTSLNPFDSVCSAESAPGYSAVILCVPDSTFVALYSTEQVDASPPAALNVQVGELNVPFRLDLKLTDPVGLDRVPLAVSLTVAVHVVGCETTTLGGLQLTAVVVSRAAAHACGHATSAQPRTSVRTAGLTPRRGSPSSIFESTFAILGMVAILTLDVRRSCVAEFRPKNGG
jgi:hypothetical protein